MRTYPGRYCLVVALAGSILLAGCAQIRHHPVGSFEKPQGIPYYLGSWYLLAYTDGKGGVESHLLYMMDPRRRMEARPRSWFASLDSLLKMDGGILTRAETTVDTTAAPTAIFEAAQKAASILVAMDPTKEGGIPAPSIYRVKVDPPDKGAPTVVTFVGSRSTFAVEVF